MKSPLVQLDIDGCLEILIVYKTSAKFQLQSRTHVQKDTVYLQKKQLLILFHEYFYEVIF